MRRPKTLALVALGLVAGTWPALAREAPAPVDAAVPATDEGLSPPVERSGLGLELGRELGLELGLEIVQGGLTERGVVERALRVSRRVRTAEAASEHARHLASWSAADFAPRVDLSASYMRLSEVKQQPFDFGGVSVDNPFPQILNQYAVRASVTVPISDYFLSIVHRYEAAGESAELARYQLEVQRQADALRAREAYLEYARVVASEHVARDAEGLLDAHVRDLEALFAAALVTQADVLQAQAQRVEAGLQRARLQAAIAVRAAGLRLLLRLEPATSLGFAEDLTADTDWTAPDLADLRARALSRRPELQALERLARVQEHSEAAAGAARWPRVSLVAGLDVSNPNPRSLPQKEEFSATWNLGVVVAWSPNDLVAAGLREDSVAAEAAATQADLADLREQISLAVMSAVTQLDLAIASTRAAAAGVRASRAAWRVQQDLLGAGESTPSALLQAEAALRRAQQAFVDVRIDVRVAQARLEYAVGGGVSP